MASSSSSSNTFHHARSNSLPSRPHPVISQLQESLNSLRSSDTACSSSASLTCKINGLQDLHECVDRLLLLPLVQQAFFTNRSSVKELLDGSLGLLDLCSTARNSLVQMKEAVHKLHSSLRRRKVGESAINDGIRNYLRLRKSVQIAMRKAVLSLKGRKDDSKSSALAKDDEAEAFVALLREAEAATIAIFGSVFCSISGSRQTRLSSGWSLISKVMLRKRAAAEEEKVEENLLTKQDIALSLIGHKTGKVHDLVRLQQLQDGLRDLDLEIQDLEEGLEGLHRRLIRSRVSLLNITNH